MLKIENLRKTFRGPAGPVNALSDAALAVAPGEFVSVQGPSGCGKTTLLLAAGGLLPPDSGRVQVDGQDVYALPAAERARLRAEKIGFVFQQFHLVPYLSVLDNVLAASLSCREPFTYWRALKLARQRFAARRPSPSDMDAKYKASPQLAAATKIALGLQADFEDNYYAPIGALVLRAFADPARRRALELVRQFGLSERLGHVPAQLSTGERQRTALARAMLNDPKLILADEPTGNLDEENSRIVLSSLHDFARSGGAVLLVTHDPAAAEYAGRRLQFKGSFLCPVESG